MAVTVGPVAPAWSTPVTVAHPAVASLLTASVPAGLVETAWMVPPGAPAALAVSSANMAASPAGGTAIGGVGGASGTGTGAGNGGMAATATCCRPDQVSGGTSHRVVPAGSAVTAAQAAL